MRKLKRLLCRAVGHDFLPYLAQRSEDDVAQAIDRVTLHARCRRCGRKGAALLPMEYVAGDGK